MLTGDAKDILNTLRSISERLGENAELMDYQEDFLRKIEYRVGEAVDACRETLEVLEDMEFDGVLDAFETPDKTDVLKNEVDALIASLAEFE